AGVVEQDVDAAVLGDDRRDAGAHARAIGDVEYADPRLETSVAKLRRRLFELGLLAAVQNDLGARARESSRDGKAETAVRARDERDLAGEIEEGEGHGKDSARRDAKL